MIRDYYELYLDEATSNFGAMLDYAVGSCGEELTAFYRRFMASGIDRQLDEWNSKYVCGMSGIELAREVAVRTGPSLPDRAPFIDMGSPEYWTGWTLAWLHGKLGVDYRTFELRGFPVQALYERYPVLHEADPTKALSFAREALEAHAKQDNRLRRARKNAGLTQQALATHSGSTLRAIRAYEQGQLSLQNAGAESVLRLCRVLGCAPSDLLPVIV